MMSLLSGSLIGFLWSGREDKIFPREPTAIQEEYGHNSDR